MTTVREWLEVSSCWRCASLMFASPARETNEELAGLAASLPPDQREAIARFAAVPHEEWQAEYHRVLGPAGIPACESAYEENALAGRGPVLAGIAGYYKAFAYHPDPAMGETPDHLAIELGFLSFMALKIAFALHQGLEEELAVTMRAYEKFREEHPAHWLDLFVGRMASCRSAIFEPAAHWLQNIRQWEKSFS